MARRRGLDRADVVRAALEVVDGRGADAVSLAAVADRLGVRPPSLYSHVDGLDGLLDELAVTVTGEFSEALRTSVLGRAGDDALTAFAAAYRRWASEHPGRYELTLRHTVNRADDKKAAGRGAVEAMDAVLRGYGIEGRDAVRTGRSLRAALHGFVSLEAGDSLGRGSRDESFEELVGLFLGALRASAATPAAG